MKPNKKQVKGIAEELDAGMKCFYNLKTGELKTIMNFDEFGFGDEEFWEKDIKEIEKNKKDYVEFTAMESHESYKIMEAFVDKVKDTYLQNKLINILNKSKPFSNFNWQIGNSDYRQEWFDFRAKSYEDWVEKEIEWKIK